jgi:hypothetical protein
MSIIKRNNKAFLVVHQGLGDIILCNGMINYLTTFYEHITVVVQKCFIDSIKELYKYNPNISFYEIVHEKDFSKKYGLPVEEYNKMTTGYDVYAAGLYAESWCTSFNVFPFCFYDDLKIPRSVFWTHQHIEISDDAKLLYDTIKQYPYVFIANKTSRGAIFDNNTVLHKLNINKDDILVISPHANLYEVGHKYYDIAQEFLKHRPLPHYTVILENAAINILSDSSIYALCHLLNIKTDMNYVISRGYNFSLIYNKETYECTDVNIRVKFQQIWL